MDISSVPQEQRICKSCGVVAEPRIVEKPTGVHHAKEVCSHCGSFFKWIKKPKNEGKRDRNMHSPQSLGIDFCQMCLRHKDRLGSRGILIPHHVHEVNANGPDIPSNIWVLCSCCHALVHHQRTYLYNHFKGGYYSIGDLQKDFEKHNVPQNVRDIMTRIFQSQEAINGD